MVNFIAKTLQLTDDGEDLTLGFVDDDGNYHIIIVNTNQVKLLMRQCAEIISRCSIVRPVP